MDIVQAKAIPLRRIFAVLKLDPTPTLNGLDLYPSPFNPEQQSMLVVNPATNTWVDPVANEEGDSVSLVCRYLESQDLRCGVMDALRWLRNMIGHEHRRINLPPSIPDYTQADSLYRIKEETYLFDPLLIGYLEDQRGLPFGFARTYFKQVTVLNTANGKSFIALGVKNEDGGFAIRNQLNKAHVGKRAITFIRGRKHKPANVHVFKDMFDYLSIVLLRNGRRFDGDSIILNSADCLQDMTGYIANYGYRYLHSWMSSDSAGAIITNLLHAFSIAEGLSHIDHRERNKGFYDLNAMLTTAIS